MNQEAHMTTEEIVARMKSGEMYNDAHPLLEAERASAARLCDEYNSLYRADEARRTEILGELLRHAGKNARFERFFRCEFGFNISVGDNFFANYDCVMLDCNDIIIGDNVMFGPNVTIATPVHPLLAEERAVQQFPDGYYDLEYAKPITICDDVWLASNVVVNGGVTIGKGSVIGSGSVVTRDIPAGVIAVGNPCRVLRKLTPEDSLFKTKREF